MNRTVKIEKAPFLRSEDTVTSLMGDMLIVLLFLYAVPLYLYGLRVLKNLIVSLFLCYGADQLLGWHKNRRFCPRDLSAMVTGAMLPLLYPASVPLWVILTADLFAVLIAKYPFGGLGNNPFNPAAAAFCFTAVSWSERVFLYPAPGQWLRVFGAVGEGVRYGKSMAGTLQNNGRPLYDVLEILSGNTAGAIGTGCFIVIAAATVFLLYRRTVNYQIPAGVLLGAAVCALLFPRITTGRLQSLWFELTGGMLVFGAVFMASDPVTSPKHPYAKWIYGGAIGVLTMLFRYFGKMEFAFPFALLIANSFTPFLDKIGTGIDRYTDIPLHRIVGRRRRGEGGDSDA